MKKILLLLFCFTSFTVIFAQEREVEDLEINELKAASQNILVNKDLVDFKVYPNPTKNNLTVNIGKLNSGMSFQISDVLGNLVYSRNITSYDLQKDSFKLDMSSFREGIYMFSLKTKTASKAIKVVKL